MIDKPHAKVLVEQDYAIGHIVDHRL